MSAKSVTTEKICTIFQEIQHNRLTHQRSAASLVALYDAVSFEEFVRSFMNCIRIMFSYDTESKYVLSSMKFAAGFIAKIAERDDAKNDSEEAPTHPLLRRVILEVLKHHNREDYKQRYHACNFITLILDSIGENANLDNDLCDEIQDAMLERIRDQKSIIRERSIEAMQRLQDPGNKECPVITAYLNSLKDSNSMIRAAVVKVAAPCLIIMTKIVESVHDLDAKVRLQAFLRLSQLRPNCLKIIERQAVLQSGFDETNKQAKKVFHEVLLQKWLSAYDGNYLLLLKAIKLDADERDIENTDEISTNIMEVFLKTHSINDLINYLPLDEDKLIPYEKLLTEVASFWNILYSALNKKEETEDIRARIVPDLLPFCKYVDKFIADKHSNDLETWQFLEYQFILLKLFDMVRSFDMSDEAGRKALHQLVTDTLLKRSLGKPVISTLLNILEKLNPDMNSLIEEVIDIIRNVLDPIVDVQPTKEDMQQHNFKLAELDVKINILYEEVEEAVVQRDMKLAYEKEEALKLLREEKNQMQSALMQPRQEKQHSKDPAHKCKSFDILNSLLELKSLKKLNQSLKLFRNEMLIEMESFVDVEHHKRAFKSCCLYALLDRECAEEYLKFIYSPVLLHRSVPELDMATLQGSMMTICDLLFLYGPKLFKTEESDSSSNMTVCKRKLYNPDIEDLEPSTVMECSAERLIDIIISMLTSDIPEIKETACKVLARLVYSGMYVSSSIFTRILIEWCNPVNIQINPKISTMFGVAMFHFAIDCPQSQVIIENSVIPAFSVIGNAPKTSPLTDINVDHVIGFICNLTRPINHNSIVDTHKTLSYTLCNTLDKNLEGKCAVIWAKLLLALEPPHNDKKALEELKCQVEGFLEDVNNSIVKKKLRKYHAKILIELNRVSQTILEENTGIDESANEPAPNPNPEQEPQKSDKRSASGSDTDNSPKNPKKKPKLSVDIEVQNDDKDARNTSKRVLNFSASSQEGEEGVTKQAEKRQRLEKCEDSGDEVEVAVHPNGIKSVLNKRDSIIETNAGVVDNNKKESRSSPRKKDRVHDKENVIQKAVPNQNNANILQNIIIPQSQTIKQTKKVNNELNLTESSDNETSNINNSRLNGSETITSHHRPSSSPHNTLMSKQTLKKMKIKMRVDKMIASKKKRLQAKPSRSSRNDSLKSIGDDTRSPETEKNKSKLQDRPSTPFNHKSRQQGKKQKKRNKPPASSESDNNEEISKQQETSPIRKIARASLNGKDKKKKSLSKKPVGNGIITSTSSDDDSRTRKSISSKQSIKNKTNHISRTDIRTRSTSKHRSASTDDEVFHTPKTNHLSRSKTRSRGQNSKPNNSSDNNEEHHVNQKEVALKKPVTAKTLREASKNRSRTRSTDPEHSRNDDTANKKRKSKRAASINSKEVPRSRSDSIDSDGNESNLIKKIKTTTTKDKQEKKKKSALSRSDSIDDDTVNKNQDGKRKSKRLTSIIAKESLNDKKEANTKVSRSESIDDDTVNKKVDGKRKSKRSASIIANEALKDKKERSTKVSRSQSIDSDEGNSTKKIKTAAKKDKQERREKVSRSRSDSIDTDDEKKGEGKRKSKEGLRDNKEASKKVSQSASDTDETDDDAVKKSKNPTKGDNKAKRKKVQHSSSDNNENAINSTKKNKSVAKKDKREIRKAHSSSNGTDSDETENVTTPAKKNKNESRTKLTFSRSDSDERDDVIGNKVKTTRKENAKDKKNRMPSSSSDEETLKRKEDVEKNSDSKRTSISKREEVKNQKGTAKKNKNEGRKELLRSSSDSDEHDDDMGKKVKTTRKENAKDKKNRMPASSSDEDTLMTTEEVKKQSDGKPTSISRVKNQKEMAKIIIRTRSISTKDVLNEFGAEIKRNKRIINESVNNIKEKSKNIPKSPINPKTKQANLGDEHKKGKVNSPAKQRKSGKHNDSIESEPNKKTENQSKSVETGKKYLTPIGTSTPNNFQKASVANGTNPKRKFDNDEIILPRLRRQLSGVPDKKNERENRLKARTLDRSVDEKVNNKKAGASKHIEPKHKASEKEDAQKSKKEVISENRAGASRNKRELLEESRNESILNTSLDSVKKVEVRISHRDAEQVNAQVKMMKKTKSSSDSDQNRSSDRIAKKIKLAENEKKMRLHRKVKHCII